jgi:endonuclease/exonuclease/phosphatase (EEP) superfamily protein YafD
LHILTLMAAAGLGAITLASFLGDWSWRFDLASHFRPQLALGALAALAVAGFARAALPAVLLLGVLAANAAPLLPRLAGAAETEIRCAPPGGLRVLTLNLHGAATDPVAFAALIAAESPDVVLLTELPKDMAPLLADHPALPEHRVVERRGSPFDVALLSRWPIAHWRVDRSVSPGLPVLEADICRAEATDAGNAAPCVRLVGLHAARPLERGGVPQDAQLALAAAAASRAPDGRAVVMGDLNLTPWSPRFARLLTAGGLDDASRYRPLDATWASSSAVVGLALDHVLVGPGMSVACSRLGAEVGSDHLPVIADLAIAGEAPVVPTP